MSRVRDRGSVVCLCGAGSLLVPIATALACPDGINIGGGIIGTVASGCGHGCGPQDCGNNLPPPPAALDAAGRGGPPFPIDAVEFTFLPNAPIIKPETTVRWTNASTAFQHNVVRFGMWESPVLFPGEIFDFRFTSANAGFDYFYECSIHPGMEGHINVTNFGDANLDGTVNLNDFNVLAANFGQTGRVWEQGDFNEDGTVNLNDFNLLAANFGKTIQPAPADATITIAFGLGAFVPEPLSAAAPVLPALLLGRRRRMRAHVTASVIAPPSGSRSTL